MRIAIISPYTLPVNRGNSLTAERIKKGLIKKGMAVSIFDSSKDSIKETAAFHPDIVHCLHGNRTQLFISELYDHISAPLITTLTGTNPATTTYDLNPGGNPFMRRMLENLDTANAIKLHL